MGNNRREEGKLNKMDEPKTYGSAAARAARHIRERYKDSFTKTYTVQLPQELWQRLESASGQVSKRYLFLAGLEMVLDMAEKGE
jgi:hypothetical protein